MHKGISIFWSEKSDDRLSTKIRGREISQFLDCKLNPESGYGNDVCIYLKPNNLDLVKTGWWVDVLDGGKFVKKLRGRPDLRLITCTQNSYEYIGERFPNEIVSIPHQHINWERHKRERKEITTCGYTGTTSPISREIYSRVGGGIKSVGFDFKHLFRIKRREKASNFYRNIDILVIGAWELGEGHPHRIPTKIINAASYGVPTIAYPILGYKEVEGYYTQIHNMKELLEEVVKFKDPDYYAKKTEGLVEMAEKYHIENVAKLYKKLT